MDRTAATLVLEKYEGDAGRIWTGGRTAVDIRRDLESFPGIGQKKAAMAVEILARDLGVEISQLDGSDVAYDVHLRRVFLRAGLVDRDNLSDMVAAARALYPQRPGALDMPAWDVGRRWCDPGIPDCAGCPVSTACPRLVGKSTGVRGA